MALGIPNLTSLGLDHFIGEDAGEVRLAGNLLPGIIQALEISTTLRVDQALMVSGAMRSQPLGFSAPRVRLTLALVSEAASFPSIADQVRNLVAGRTASPAGEGNTCYVKARALDALQRAVDSDGNPVRYRLTNVHTLARGVAEVWFSRLDTSEAHDDSIVAVCEFAPVETHSFAELRTQVPPAVIKSDAQPLTLADEDSP